MPNITFCIGISQINSFTSHYLHPSHALATTSTAGFL